MIPIPSGVRVWIATGHTDMRRGMQSLALTVHHVTTITGRLLWPVWPEADRRAGPLFRDHASRKQPR